MVLAYVHTYYNEWTKSSTLGKGKENMYITTGDSVSCILLILDMYITSIPIAV